MRMILIYDFKIILILMEIKVYMVLLNKKFSEELNRSLEKEYKRQLKNAEFATFYNLQFNRSITSETARKWIRGESVPNVHTINDLANWLKMDLSGLFKI